MFTPLEILENKQRYARLTSYSLKSDVYSLLMLLYSIFKMRSDKYGSAYFFQNADVNNIKARLREFESEASKKDFLAVFPPELRPLASRALSPNPALRPDLLEIKQNPWFQDNLVKGIYYLENFYSLQESNKPIFLAGMAKTVQGYSTDIVERRIVPFIYNNMIHQPLMYNLTILALVICEKKLIASLERRKEVMWPIFLSLLKSKKISGQLLYLLVAYIDVICELLNEQEVQAHIVNLLFKCFDCKVPQIQLICIEKTYTLCQKVPFGEMKSKILPRMLMLCNDPDPKVKKRALQFIKERIDLLDPSLVQSQAFTIIESNLSQNNPASINFLLLDLMEDISKHYDVEMITSKVLPILISFLANKSSSKQEFEKYFDSIIKFITRIKDKRTQELNSQPFRAKPDEPDDQSVAILTLDQVIASTKVEGGFDALFAKQNQLGAPSPSTGIAGPVPGSQPPAFSFDHGLLSGSQNPQTPAPFSSGGFGAAGFQSTGSAPKDDFDFSGFSSHTPAPTHSLPKPPEKQSLQSTQPKMGLTGIGDLTALAGFDDFLPPSKPQLSQQRPAHSSQPSGGFGAPQSKPAQRSNYDALDDLSLGQGSLGGFSLDPTPASGFGAGLGSFGMKGGNGTGGALGSGGFAPDSSMGGLRSFGQTGASEPFDRGMSGLMINAGGFEDLGLGLGGGQQPSLGGFGSPAPGGFGQSTGGFGSGMGGLSLSGTGLGTGMNSQDLFAGLGGLGPAQPLPSLGGVRPFQTTLKPKPQQPGILSNPSLTFKSAQKPAPAASNLNDFDLL
jgi:hypothetical protein